MKKQIAILIMIAVFAMSAAAQTTGKKYFTVKDPEKIANSNSEEMVTVPITDNCLEVALSPGYSGDAPWCSISLLANRNSNTSSYGSLFMRPNVRYLYTYNSTVLEGVNSRYLSIRNKDGGIVKVIDLVVPKYDKNHKACIIVYDESNPVSKGQWIATMTQSDGERLMKWILQYFETYNYTKASGCLYLDF